MASINRGSTVELLEDFKTVGVALIKRGTVGVLVRESGVVNEPVVKFPGRVRPVAIDREYLQRVA